MAAPSGRERTRAGRCPAHGRVTAVKAFPRPSWPFLVYAGRVLAAAVAPYRCPACGRRTRRPGGGGTAPVDGPAAPDVPQPYDAPADAVISVRGLRMRYGGFEAVRGIDLDVRRGEILAFLGPNGAGKTTTVEILEGFRQRSGGEVLVLGVDPQSAGPEWRARIGVVLQESRPEAELTVRECLSLYAGYYPRPRSVDETLALVGLSGTADVRCVALSGGQRRRLDVALALVGDPELVFLDEPTTGFDPAARRAAWEVVAGLRSLGVTVFLTTHYMDEAEYLADRIVVISAGRVVASGTPATLGGRASAPTTVAFTLPPPLDATALPEQLQALAEGTGGDPGRVTLRTTTPLAHLAVLAAWAERQGVEPADLRVGRPSLEDVYLELVEARR